MARRRLKELRSGVDSAALVEQCPHRRYWCRLEPLPWCRVSLQQLLARLNHPRRYRMPQGLQPLPASQKGGFFSSV